MGSSEGMGKVLSWRTVIPLLWVTNGIVLYNSHGLGVGGEI